MNPFRKTLLVTGLLVSFSTASLAAIDPAKAADIKAILQLTEGEERAKVVAPEVARLYLGQLKSDGRELPAQAASVIEAEFVKIFLELVNAPDGLQNEFISLYDANFSHEEIKALLTFYKTPIGRKFVIKQPLLLEASRQIGQKVGQGIRPQFTQRINAALKREGFIK